MITHNYVLGLDVGSKRIGIAIASLTARIAKPLTTLPNDDKFYKELKAIIKEENVSVLVIGLPRGLRGQDTEQTKFTKEFTQKLTTKIPLPVHLIDEALTSKQAEAELRKKRKTYKKADIDALAATYILDDWLADLTEAI